MRFGLISIIHSKIKQLTDVVWINIDYSSKNQATEGCDLDLVIT
jgi:hypothetical protein